MDATQLLLFYGGFGRICVAVLPAWLLFLHFLCQWEYLKQWDRLVKCCVIYILQSTVRQCLLNNLENANKYSQHMQQFDLITCLLRIQTMCAKTGKCCKWPQCNGNLFTSIDNLTILIDIFFTLYYWIETLLMLFIVLNTSCTSILNRY